MYVTSLGEKLYTKLFHCPGFLAAPDNFASENVNHSMGENSLLKAPGTSVSGLWIGQILMMGAVSMKLGDWPTMEIRQKGLPGNPEP
jgi:hypothetical protein